MRALQTKQFIIQKKTDTEIRTFYAGATEIYTSKAFASAEDFLAFVKEAKELSQDTTRFQNTKNEYKIDTTIAPLCVSYNQTSEDHGAKNLGSNLFLLVENHGLVCLHPDSQKVSVDVYYSDRSVPSEQNLFLKKEGEAFIQSLRFLSFATDTPTFLKSIKQESFFPNGMNEWKLQKNIYGDNNFFLQWENSSSHEITLKYRNATPDTIQAVYQSLLDEIGERIKEVGGDIVNLSDFFSVIRINDTPRDNSFNLIYATPEGAYWWKYKTPNTFNTNFENYIDTITSVARKHQYDVAIKYGNVVMGRWGGPVHEFAKLLARQNDSISKIVYKNLLETSPSNYDAQIEYTYITKNEEEIQQAAEIVRRDAEEESLLNASAEILSEDIPSILSYPILGIKDNGLKVILIPLEPCNPWLIDEIAKTYEKITTIPVVARRLPVKWSVPEPSRSAYRTQLVKIASNIWKTKPNFNDWSLSKLKEEIMNEAKKEGPRAVTVITQLFKKMERDPAYQWDADPIVVWLSQAIAPYFSKDPNTMVVGITELDIYSGESNFVFSTYGGLNDSPVSILSYAKMRAKFTRENQSRKRLTDRVAKELVPASLKRLDLPRSLDPSCPYSYSSGLQRLDEKTLNLSGPLQRKIKRIKDSILDHGATHQAMDEPDIVELRKEADQGDAKAQDILGAMYAKGLGVPQDDKQAFIWCRKAAEQGMATSQFNLGIMYAKGQGVPQDDKQAFIWFQKAAEQGVAQAQINLGSMYASGQGVLQDYKQTFIWFQKAAEQGDPIAQINLGAMYARGQGVTQNDISAYAWFCLAATQGKELAVKNRDFIAARITPDQRSKAQALAVELQSKINKQKK